MKRPILLFCLLLSSAGFAQVFNYSGTLPAPIPDNNANNYYQISVNGLPSQIDTSFGLSQVCLSIDHQQASDLKISLTSPDGNSIILSLHNGNGGMNYTGTCLEMSAQNDLKTGTAPFTGSFLPDQSINYLNNGQDPNGTWTLTIIDVFPFFTGSLTGFSMTFTPNPPPDPAALQLICNTTNSSGCFCKDTSVSDCDLLPDLICSYVVVRDGYNENTNYIGFPNAVINVGSGPVEMQPTGNCFCDTLPVSCATVVCPDGQAPKEQINQRIYHKNANGLMTYTDRPAGFQQFHSTHNHIHVENFTLFSLRISNGDPDPLNWPAITNSIKQGYCLINMGSCNSIDSVCMSHGNVITDNMIPNHNLGTVTGCGSTGQGIFVGRYDMYGAGNGQEINLNNICNGTYYLVAVIDPFNNFLEEDETNNVIAVPITLTEQSGTSLDASFLYTTSGLTAGFVNYTTGVSHTWDFGDGTTATGMVASHTYAASGIYTVMLTVYDSSCATTSAQTVIVGTVETAENYGLFDVNIRPNPSADLFTLEFQLSEQTDVQIKVLNVLGGEVRNIPAGERLAGKHLINLYDLAKGTYFVKIEAGNKSVVKRIIKI